MTTPLPDGNYSAIIAQCFCFSNETSSKIEMVLIITTGKFKGCRINKLYHFDGALSDYILKDFAKLGILLESVAQINYKLGQAAGKTVILTAHTKTDCQQYFIFKYVGTDSLKKYI